MCECVLTAVWVSTYSRVSVYLQQGQYVSVYLQQGECVCVYLQQGECVLTAGCVCEYVLAVSVLQCVLTQMSV